MASTYRKATEQGFGVLGMLAIIVIIAGLGIGGWLTWHTKTTHTLATKTAIGTQKKTISPPTLTPPAPTDPYAGWRTYCEPVNSACIKYPGDWVPAKYGGYENAAETAFVTPLAPNVNKDGAPAETAYIYSVTSLPTSFASVDIVGFVVNNQPGYGLFASSYVADAGITAGSTKLLEIDYWFTGKDGPVTLMTTPDINGYAAIKTSDQAKAWFTTTEGQTCLKIMQSFYYR